MRPPLMRALRPFHPSASLRAVLGGSLSLVLLVGGCRKKAAEGDDEHKAPIEVHCVPAARAAVEEKLVLRGRLAPPPGGDLPVASQIAGRVIETRVHEGDRLAKGTVVASVDDLAPRAAAKEAGAALARVKAADVAAESALVRARDLAARGIASKKDVEDATARAEAAHAEVDAETAAVRLASGTLGRVEVRTTFDGVVTRVFRGAGALVDGTAATPILQIAAVDAWELVADATERELSRVQEGQKAEILLAAGGKLAGAVVARARALDPATGLGAVRIRVEKEAGAGGDGKDKGDKDKDDKKDDEPAGPPPLGAFARATLLLGRREGALMLPASAIRGAAADGAEIAVCKGDKVEIRTVTVGYREPGRVEIAEGLKEGEKVAVDHVLGLDEEATIVEVAGEPAKEGDKEGDEKGKGKGDKGRKDDEDPPK
jgi:HlyD family secretion protein